MSSKSHYLWNTLEVKKPGHKEKRVEKKEVGNKEKCLSCI